MREDLCRLVSWTKSFSRVIILPIRGFSRIDIPILSEAIVP